MAGEGLLNRPVWGPGLLNQRPSLASLFPGGVGGAALTAYEPTWRDRAAIWAQGMGLPRDTTAGIFGSTGLGVGAGPGPGGGGLLDLTTVPAIPFYLDEAERAREAGDVVGQAMDTVSALPLFGLGMGVADDVVRASRSARLYNPPVKSPRPFEADYPSGALVDDAGNLLSIEGKPLVARHVVGRTVVGGEDQAISPAELDALGEAVTGRRPEVASIGGRTVGVYEKRPLTKGEWEDLRPHERSGHSGTSTRIIVDRRLDADSAPKVLAHETAHAINDISGSDVFYKAGKRGRKVPFGEIPVSKEMLPELGQVYRDLNGGKMPDDFGYAGDDIRSELMAEAIRAYMADPNYIKTVAPKTAAAIRKAVNDNPRLRDYIQFNTVAPVAAAGAGGALFMSGGDEADAAPASYTTGGRF